MKIAQIAPLAESCPPGLYGGSERIVSYLTEELVDLGHDVTLFATGDSKTSAELVACAEIALRLNPKVHDPLPYHIMMLEQVRQRAHEFDVLHFHIHVLHFPIIRQFADKTVRAGLPLKIAAKVDRHDQAYWDEKIEPMIKAHPNVEYLEEICENQKARFLGDALALLFPIGWPEPFGLVMIESMACGTPVIAFRSGSVPEVIDEGVSGFVVNSVEEAANAVSRLSELDRAAVRAAFDNRFTAGRMARTYLKIYAALPGVRRKMDQSHRISGNDIGSQLPL